MSGAARAAQLHYWSLTRKRIGTKFLGLDHAGNVLLFPAYRSTWFGGWVPVTMSFQTNRPQTMLMEDGYPMHHKSSMKLQQTVQARQQEREKLRMERIEAKIKKGMQSQTQAATTVTGMDDVEEDDIAFIQRVARDCSEPVFVKKFLRVSRWTTRAYMAVYFSLWGCVAYIVHRCYKAFKAWLNPPARSGIEHLERKAMYYPNCIRDLWNEYVYSTAIVQYLAELVAENITSPLKDAVSPQLSRYQIRWASQHERQRQRQVEDDALELELASNATQRRVWWERSMVSLLLAIIFICLL